MVLSGRFVRRGAALAIGVVVVLPLLSGCRMAAEDTPPPSSRPTSSEGPLQVQYVSDGDTIGVRMRSGVERVRLIGVDTPETKKPGAAVQCWGPQASQTTRDLLLGQRVWLEYDDVVGETDAYGRRLAYVWLGDELINQRLIAAGAGRQYAYNDQRYRYRSSFEAAEASARTGRVGLWGTC